MSDREQQARPQGWKRTTLGEALPIHYGKARSDTHGTVRVSTPVYGSSGRIDTFNRALTSGPSLIIGRKGNVGSAYYSPEPCWPIDTVYFAEASGDEDLRFFKYLLDHLQLVKKDRSTAVPGLSRADYNAMEVLVPELDQQLLVVAEIEKHFSRLDEAVANLKRVKANLKRYKASVLKAAVEGKLTEGWRKQHPDVEPASRLLERILAERRKKWSGKGKYKEPSQFLEEDCPDLPANWAWASLDSIANVIDPNPSHRMPKYVDNGVPFISSENFIGSDDIAFTIGKTVPDKVLQEQKARCAIREGDFVLTRIGTIGKTRFLPLSQTYCLSHALVIIQGLTSDIDRRYLRYVVASDATIEQAKLGVQSVGVPDLGMAKIRAFRIPLTCEAEQKEIVAEVERRLSVIEELEAAVQANLIRADRLRQSILQKAFKGELTVQFNRTKVAAS